MRIYPVTRLDDARIPTTIFYDDTAGASHWIERTQPLKWHYVMNRCKHIGLNQKTLARFEDENITIDGVIIFNIDYVFFIPTMSTKPIHRNIYCKKSNEWQLHGKITEMTFDRSVDRISAFKNFKLTVRDFFKHRQK